MKKIFLATMLVSALALSACGGKTTNSTDSATATADTTQQSMMTAPANQEHAMLGVKGKCEQCKDRIEKAAKSVDGVSMAMWDQEKQELHLNFDPAKTNVEAISKAIAVVGHDTDKDKATQAAYDALPSCCKYRG